MPRYANTSEERWLHPSYRKAYCFKYKANGMCYTSVNSKRQATGYEFLLKNRKICMQILENRLMKEFNKDAPVHNVRFVKDLIIQFHRDHVQRLDIKTRSCYKAVYKQFLNVDIPVTDSNAIRTHVINVKNSLNVANNTIWKRMQRVRKIFEYGVELEWLEKNPIPKALIPVYEKKGVVISTKEQIHLIIDYFNNTELPIMALMVEFAYETALRIQEIINIEWTDISNNVLNVKGKGGIPRQIPLRSFPRCIAIFNVLKSMNLPKPFPWQSQQNPARYLRKAASHLKGLYPEMDWEIGFHIIRKTTINQWRNAGVPVEVRNLISGHSRDVEKGYYLSTPELEYLEKELKILSKN